MKKFNLKLYFFDTPARKTRKKFSFADLLYLIGMVIFVTIGVSFVILFAKFIGSLLPKNDYLEFGRYLTFHYVFFTSIGLIMIRFAQLCGKKNKKEYIVDMFLNKASFMMGVTLFAISIIAAFFHVTVSVITIFHSFSYIIMLLEYS